VQPPEDIGWRACARHTDLRAWDRAARAPPAGFKKLVKDANLELKVYDMEQMSRLFMVKGGAKVRVCHGTGACMRRASRALVALRRRGAVRCGVARAAASAQHGSSV
jgi:hypothetical protein